MSVERPNPEAEGGEVNQQRSDLRDWVDEQVARDRAAREALDVARGLAWRVRMRKAALELLKIQDIVERLQAELAIVEMPDDVLELLDRAADEVMS